MDLSGVERSAFDPKRTLEIAPSELANASSPSGGGDRALTQTFAGIRSDDVPGFALTELLSTAIAALVVGIFMPAARIRTPSAA